MQIFQGIDITSVSRMQAAVERRGKPFLNRIFTPQEQAYCETKRMKYEHYAARFAAKEAAMKAFEIRKGNRYRFREIEVRRAATGKPFIYLSPKARKLFGVAAKNQIELSMAHEREFAVATVIMVKP
jgi:holo-[acyl-carrier protein] synthase